MNTIAGPSINLDPLLQPVIRVNHGSMQYEIKEVSTIGDVKRALEHKTSVPTKNQLLLRDGEFLLINNYLKIEEMNINLYTRFNLYIKKVTPSEQVHLHVIIPRNDILTISDVPSDERVSSFKQRIDARYGLSPFRQHLTTMNVTMSNRDSLYEYLIDNMQVLFVKELPRDPSRHLHLYIVTGSSITDQVEVDVDPKDTVYCLHGEIRRIGVATGLDFYFMRRLDQLKGDNTFEHYNIKNNDPYSLGVTERAIIVLISLLS